MGETERCKTRIYDGSFMGHGCTRKAVRDGFCQQHHPDTVKANRRVLNAKVDAMLERGKKHDRISAAKDAVIQAAEAWRDNPGYPRSLALANAVDDLREARK